MYCSNMLKLFLFAALVTSTTALYDWDSGVIELTPSNFDELVTQSDDIWLVEFFAPWCEHCKTFVSDYMLAAKALKGVAKVGAVNADDHKSLAMQYSITGYPAVRIFGVNKETPQVFDGERTAIDLTKAIVSAVKRKIKMQLDAEVNESRSPISENVIELTDENFDELVIKSEDPWMVEFFAPWCTHCQDLAPHWIKAARELKGKIKFGALDCTVHTETKAEYEVRSYPTIKFFAAKDKEFVLNYGGNRTSSEIVAWATKKLTEGSSASAVKVLQITSEKPLVEACKGKSLCIMAFLPHILDCRTPCRHKYLDMLKNLAEKYKMKQWGWVWSEAGIQENLEILLEVGRDIYPVLIAANYMKLKYTPLQGAFTKKGIDAFLRDISFGKSSTYPVKTTELPKIATVEAWDGTDGPYQEDIIPEEQEIISNRDEL